MESAYTLTFPAFVAMLGLVAWFLVQRQIKKADEDAAAREKAIDAKFADHVTRMNQHGDRLREAELKLAEKVGREELEKVTDKMTASVEGLRAEWKQDLTTLQTTILAAVSHNRG